MHFTAAIRERLTRAVAADDLLYASERDFIIRAISRVADDTDLPTDFATVDIFHGTHTDPALIVALVADYYIR